MSPAGALLLRALAALAILGLSLGSRAAALDPCASADVRATLRQARTAPEIVNCKRDQILLNYLTHLASMVDSAELTEDDFDSPAQKTNLTRAAAATSAAIAVLQGTPDGGAEFEARVDVLQRAGSDLRSPLRTLDPDDLELDVRLALCQAELDWRLAKAWKQGLDDCPAPAPLTEAEPASPLDDEEDAEDDGDAGGESPPR